MMQKSRIKLYQIKLIGPNFKFNKTVIRENFIQGFVAAPVRCIFIRIIFTRRPPSFHIPRLDVFTIMKDIFLYINHCYSKSMKNYYLTLNYLLITDLSTKILLFEIHLESNSDSFDETNNLFVKSVPPGLTTKNVQVIRYSHRQMKT